MKTLPNPLLELAFGLNENDHLSKEQQDIVNEWVCGKGEYLMKISFADSRFLEYAGYYERLDLVKSSKWEQINRIE